MEDNTLPKKYLPLRNMNKPIGVAEYYLTKELPDKFKYNLPSPELLKKKLLERQ